MGVPSCRRSPRVLLRCDSDRRPGQSSPTTLAPSSPPIGSPTPPLAAYPSTGQRIASSCRVRTPEHALRSRRLRALPWRSNPMAMALATLVPGFAGGDDGGSESKKAIHLLVERYREAAAKSYTSDGNYRLQVHWEKHESLLNTVEDENADSLIPQVITDFVLPAGFLGSVSDDFQKYMLLRLPTNMTGWICHTLVTSSLLKAVGVGSFTGTSAAASAAAIRYLQGNYLSGYIPSEFGDLVDLETFLIGSHGLFIGKWINSVCKDALQSPSNGPQPSSPGKAMKNCEFLFMFPTHD